MIAIHKSTIYTALENQIFKKKWGPNVSLILKALPSIHPIVTGIPLWTSNIPTRESRQATQLRANWIINKGILSKRTSPQVADWTAVNFTIKVRSMEWFLDYSTSGSSISKSVKLQMKEQTASQQVESLIKPITNRKPIKNWMTIWR